MKIQLLLFALLALNFGLAQTESENAVARTTTLSVEDGTVTVLQLAPGYTSSVRLPEEISSVVIGDPADFKAEHSEAEPRLVFLKPITLQPAQSNALITTKSGHEISLQLISSGQPAGNATLDFLVDYRLPSSMMINAGGRPEFLIPETGAAPASASLTEHGLTKQVDVLGMELEAQKAVSSPAWQGKDLLVAVGDSTQHGDQTSLRFSILNNSKRVMELLPPQIEFSGIARSEKKSRIQAEPIAISEYRMTTRRLAPGERADGLVVFDHPAFKESSEKLELQLAEAAQVDQPVLVPIAFTATKNGGGQ
jgi:hypothetical protein